MTKISIVVPVYNVEKYIRECLESLVAQTLKDIEIILVDDDSKDNSLEICKEFEKKDKRIIVKHNNKLGVSEARNTGIKLSSGKYIMFVDSDDWLETNMAEKMYEIAENSNSEIVMCNSYANTQNGEYLNDFYYKDFVFKGEDKVILQRQSIASPKNEYSPKFIACGVPWAKVYRRSFITENNLWFDKNLPRMQDMIFNLYAFEYASSIEYVSVPLYHYRKNNSSVCNVYDENMLEKYENMLSALKEFIDTTSSSKEKITEMYNQKVYNTLNEYFSQLFRKNNPKFTNKEIKDKIEKFLDKNIDSIKNMNVENLSLFGKFKRYLMVKNKLTILVLLRRIVEKKYEVKRSGNFG